MTVRWQSSKKQQKSTHLLSELSLKRRVLMISIPAVPLFVQCIDDQSGHTILLHSSILLSLDYDNGVSRTYLYRFATVSVRSPFQ